MTSGKIKKNSTVKEVLALVPDTDSCGKWCEVGSGFLADDDLDNIAQHLDMPHEAVESVYLEEEILFNTKRKRPKLLREDASLPHGKCVFMKGNNCSLGESKPLHCKVSKHAEHAEDANEWFHLNYFVNVNDPHSVREWGMRLDLREGKTIPGGQVHELVKKKEMQNHITQLHDTEYDEGKEAKQVRKQLVSFSTKKETTKKKRQRKK